jgi:hypothetical protein
MKKQRLSKSEILTPQIDKSEFQQSGNLLSKDAANQLVSAVTQVPMTTPTPQIIEVKSFGRPKKSAAIGREPFTTSVQVQLIRQLKAKALEQGVTVADLLEEMLTRFLNE